MFEDVDCGFTKICSCRKEDRLPAQFQALDGMTKKRPSFSV